MPCVDGIFVESSRLCVPKHWSSTTFFAPSAETPIRRPLAHQPSQNPQPETLSLKHEFYNREPQNPKQQDPSPPTQKVHISISQILHEVLAFVTTILNASTSFLKVITQSSQCMYALHVNK